VRRTLYDTPYQENFSREERRLTFILRSWGSPGNPHEARLGYLTLLFKVIQEGKYVKGGGNRFELIVPNERFVRDPLLPEGAPPIQSAKERADCDDGDAGDERCA